MGNGGKLPIPYSVSKWRIARWIVEQFPAHESYVVPFCGGAAVFFTKSPSKLEVLNDLEEEVVNFFQILRDREAELIRKIDLTPYARAEYHRAWDAADDPGEPAGVHTR